MAGKKRKFLIPALDAIAEPTSNVQNHFKAGKLTDEIKKSTSHKLDAQSTTSVHDISSILPTEQSTGPSYIVSKQTAESAVKLQEQECNSKEQTESSNYQAPKSKSAEEISGKKNCILVNPKQKGNPLLKHIRNVPWEFSEIEPDYIMGQKVCSLFLSLRYFNLYPQYIHERLKSLGKNFQLRVLLIQIDVTDPYPALKDLSRIAILTDCTLLLAWSFEEAGKCIETFKVFENKSPDMIMEKLEGDTYVKLIDSLSSVKSVNRTDAMTLLSTFGTMEKIFSSSPEELSLCPGMGFLKAKRLCDVLQQPFIQRK